MSEPKYIRPEEACRILKVTTRTLYNWTSQGKLQSVKTKGGHNRYVLSEVISKAAPEEPEDNKKKICYCRVSSYGQRNDLERQVEYFTTNYPNHIIIKDIGSGLNFKRKGLNTILDLAIQGNIQEVVVTHKDRLCRFGYELIERIIEERSNGNIVVLNQKQTSPKEELVDDLLSIITVFSSRLYGLRSHQFKDKIKAFKNDKTENVSDENGENPTETNDGSIPLVL